MLCIIFICMSFCLCLPPLPPPLSPPLTSSPLFLLCVPPLCPLFSPPLYSSGFFYVFVGGIALGSAWWEIAVAVALCFTGIIYCAAGIACKERENDLDNTNGVDKDAEPWSDAEKGGKKQPL